MNAMLQPALAGSNILIVSSSTGGGHQSAATALEDSFLSIGQLLSHPLRVTTRRVLEESTQASRRLAQFYNYLLRHHQDWMQYYYWTINHLKPNEWPMLLRPALSYGRQVMEEHAPHVMVSVHPMLQHFSAYMLKKLGLLDRIPLVSVVTDPCYGFWKGWACDAVQRYYVASEGARQQLLEYGVPDERIRIEGMPVHSKFKPMSPPERKILRQSLGLDPERMTVFLNAGWVGGGNLPDLLRAFAQADLSDIQLVFLAGHNQALYEWASHHMRPLGPQATVLATTPHMEQWMNASDVMLSKLGGLTTFEALACGLPILADGLTPPMPQERHTATYLETTGSGRLMRSPQQAVEQVLRLRDTPSELARLRQAALGCGHGGASQRIAQSILEVAHPR